MLTFPVPVRLEEVMKKHGIRVLTKDRPSDAKEDVKQGRQVGG